MRFFSNHFGMIMSFVLALCLSLIMATSAIFVDKLTFTLPLLVKNWGTAFLVIMLISLIFPLVGWSAALCRKLKIKPRTLAHDLIDDLIATLFYNTGATLVLAAVNIFANPEIEAAVEAGFLPSVSTVYWSTVLHDWPIMFVISYILAFFVLKVAIRIAMKAVGIAAAQAGPQPAVEQQ